MLIFQLAVYSCVSLTDFGGDLISKQCRWDSRGMYAERQHCVLDGEREIGKPIFSDVADGRKVEKYRCREMTVAQ